MSDSVPVSPVSETPVSQPVTNAFTLLGLSAKLTDSLTAHGYTTPTPIQAKAIPAILAGGDIVGLAATGTGKTAAFVLPIVEKLGQLPKGRKQPSALILVPTRELAIQVATAAGKYGKPLGISVTAVYGGAGFGDQARMIRQGVDIIVATPGRALDHLRRETMRLENIMTVVLDEADEMLDMGFAEDLDAILSSTPKSKQTLLFSATMPPRIAAIAQKHQTTPTRIEIAKATVAPGEAPKVRQAVCFVHRDHKVPAIARLIDFEKPASAIVFCRTRHEADSLADHLNETGYKPESLHGGMSQEQRDRVMKKFRNGSVNLLIATDVAARGLDITHLSHVINYSVPESAETYTHRIGRVGRAGREGVAITMAEPRDGHQIRNIERITKGRINPMPLPSVKELQAKRLERTRDEIKAIVEAGEMEEYRSVLEPLIGEFTIVDLALAAVKLAHNAGQPDDDLQEIPSPAMPRDRAQGPGPGAAPMRDRRPAPGNGPGPGGPGAGFNGPAPRGPARGMARIFISAGRDIGLTRRDVLAAIESEVGLNTRDIGMIDIAERFTLVDVPGDASDYVIETLGGVRLRGRKVHVRRDRAVAGV
ncbi:MAG: DEAD/DEAH box helicase [Fimbriiglobus sp.]